MLIRRTTLRAPQNSAELTLILICTLFLQVAMPMLAIAESPNWLSLRGIRSVYLDIRTASHPEIDKPSDVELLNCMRGKLFDAKIPNSQYEGVVSQEPILRLKLSSIPSDNRKFAAYVVNLVLLQTIKTKHGKPKVIYWTLSDHAIQENDLSLKEHILHNVRELMDEFISDYQKANKSKP